MQLGAMVVFALGSSEMVGDGLAVWKRDEVLRGLV